MPELTPIEKYVIERVKQLRLEKNISQDKLSIMMGLNEKFISKVETPNRAEKYNINHLNKIAEVFNCSIKDFFPDKFVPNEFRSSK